MKPRLLLLVILLALTAARFWCIGHIELTPREAVHWAWSQHPDWCYYDKGPAVAVAIRVGTALFGTHESGIRFLSPLFALGTSLILYGLVRKFYNEATAIWSVIVVSLFPLFQSESVMMTSAPVATFFWVAAMFTFWNALERGPAFSLFWPATGILAGAGFLAEYTGALELVSIALVIASAGRFRREFMRPGFWVMLVAFAPFTIPAVWWNARHEWITLINWRGQWGLNGFHPGGVLFFVMNASLACSPLIFAGMLIACGWGIRKFRKQSKSRFFILFALPPVGLGLLNSASDPEIAGWMVPAFLCLAILSVALWQEAALECRARKAFALVAIGAGLVMCIANTWMDHLAGPNAGRPPIELNEPENPLTGWKAAAVEVDQLRKQIVKKTGKPVFLIGSSDQVSAVLGFYLPDKQVEGPGHPPVYIPESQMIESQFSYWPRYDEFLPVSKEAPAADEYYKNEEGTNPFMGRGALFISDEEAIEPPEAITNGFERVELLETRGFKALWTSSGRLRIFACYNYRSSSL